MGKVVASYLVKVTLREHDEASAPPDEGAPTINDLVDIIVAAVDEEELGLLVNVTAERTDK